MQSSLFNQGVIDILPYNGVTLLHPQFFSPAESEQYFNTLMNEINLKQEPIKIFGKEVMQPRLTAWYGDSNKSYAYSGITMYPYAWTKSLQAIKQKIEPIA